MAHAKRRSDSRLLLPAGGKTAESAAWSYLDPKAESRDIGGYLSLYWNRLLPSMEMPTPG